MDHDAARCSRCGGELTPVVYGYPSPEMFEAAERGDVVLGGCMVFDGRPTGRCRSCGADAAAGTGESR